MGSRSSSSAAAMSGSRRSADGAEPSRDGTDPNRSPNTSRNNQSGNEPSRNRAAGASSGSNRAASWSGSGAAGPSSGRAEEDVDLAQVLAYLLRRGQVRLVHGGGATGLQLVQMHSDSDSDSDGAWEGRLGDQYNPPVDLNPDTCEVDRSEIKTQIRLATGAAGSKVTKSFAGLLRQREQGRCLSSSFSHGECSDIRSHLQGGVRADLDLVDFGFAVGELEVLVETKEQIPAGAERIAELVEKLGLSEACKNRVPGKMDAYLKQFHPEHYGSLLRAHKLHP